MFETYNPESFKKDSFPTISDALLARLEKDYPDKMPDMNINPVELHMQAGEIRLVRRLRTLWNQQREGRQT